MPTQITRSPKAEEDYQYLLSRLTGLLTDMGEIKGIADSAKATADSAKATANSALELSSPLQMYDMISVTPPVLGGVFTVTPTKSYASKIGRIRLNPTSALQYAVYRNIYRLTMSITIDTRAAINGRVKFSGLELSSIISVSGVVFEPDGWFVIGNTSANTATTNCYNFIGLDGELCVQKTSMKTFGSSTGSGSNTVLSVIQQEASSGTASSNVCMGIPKDTRLQITVEWFDF